MPADLDLENRLLAARLAAEYPETVQLLGLTVDVVNVQHLRVALDELDRRGETVPQPPPSAAPTASAAGAAWARLVRTRANREALLDVLEAVYRALPEEDPTPTRARFAAAVTSLREDLPLLLRLGCPVDSSGFDPSADAELGGRDA